MRHALAVFLVAAGLLAAGCAPLTTQSPGAGLSPVNAVAQGGDKHLMLFGYDVVSYFTEGRERPGSPAIKSDYKGVTFRFSKARTRRSSMPLPRSTFLSSAAIAPTASSTASPGAATPIAGR